MTTVTAGIYCRISLARDGDTTKTADQERICRELAARLGWDAVAVYTDHSQSAWKKNRKRAAWDAMLADVSAGTITGIIVYHGDRLIRQPYDLEALLGLADSKGIRLASPTGVRNLDNADDRFILRIEAAQACRASDDTSRRKKAQYERMRRAGLVRPGGAGGRALGYETDGVTIRQDEAAMIREAAPAIIAGQSVRSVLAALTARGLRSTAGNQIRQSGFTRTLLSPRMAGLMPDGESAAAWPAVLDRATWETLRIVMAGRATGRPRTGGAVHLLSGIAECGACGHPMWAGYSGSSRYRCPQDRGCGRVSRNRPLLDAYVGRRVVNLLAHPLNAAPRIPEAPGLAAEFAALTAARAEIEQAIADPARAGLTALLARLDATDARIAELRALAGDDARRRVIDASTGIIWDEWLALPLDARRSLAAACYRVVVLPATGRGPGLRTEDVILSRRG